MKIEQRIGRIDRRGQQSEIIYIFNFYNSATIEGKIYDICMQKIDVFEDLIGGLDPIIKSVEKNIIEEQFNTTLTQKEKEHIDKITKQNYEKEIELLRHEAKDIHSYYHKDVIDEKE
jgi:MoaA/NifB/PqqE/SkfB family radical SAM enzyme